MLKKISRFSRSVKEKFADFHAKKAYRLSKTRHICKHPADYETFWEEINSKILSAERPAFHDSPCVQLFCLTQCDNLTRKN